MKQIELKIVNPAIADFLPAYGTEGAAAVDLRVCLEPEWLEISESHWLEPGDVFMFRTGIALSIGDPGLAAMILPRSGIGSNKGIILGNGTGLIDSDYQGELKMAVWNRSHLPFEVKHLDRIAQMVFVPVVQVGFNIVQEFSDKTGRAEGGFGSTGVK